MLGFQSYRRRRRTAFWLLRPHGLTVAVLEPTTDEPLLVGCADVVVDAPGRSDDFAPGLLETAAAARALELPHVAALDSGWCTLQHGEAESGCEGASGTDLVVAVEGTSNLRVVVSRSLVLGTVRRFGAARLKLSALDAAPCALLNVAIHLARVSQSDAPIGAVEEADLDPLTAVSVAPECESEASRVGRALAVPVGLALARFGLVAHA
jgi:hypothetical protein